jgi:hypothetical protein
MQGQALPETAADLASALVSSHAGEPGVCTIDLSSSIIPALLGLFPAGSFSSRSSSTAGTLRPVTRWLQNFGPPLDEKGMQNRLLRMVGATSAAGAGAVASTQGAGASDDANMEPLPPNTVIPCPPGSRPEPPTLEDVAWSNEVGYSMPGWLPFAKPVYDSFTDQTGRRFSLYDFLIALICCSKGTAGEKASALFDLFTCNKLLPSCANLWHHVQHHWLPISQAARAVVQRASSDPTHSIVQSAPLAKDVRKDAALHLKIMTEHMVGKPTLMGEVVVSNLAPFTASANQEAQCMWFSIWSPPDGPSSESGRGSATPIQASGRDSASGRESAPGRICIGELDMALKWVPERISVPERGQLSIRVRAIRFFPAVVSSPQSQHPSITVSTYSANLVEQKIPCQKGTARLQLPTSKDGDVIEFHAPSRIAKGLHFSSVADSGWNQASQEWRWNATLGEQQSISSFAFQKNQVIEAGSNPRVIDIWAVRTIVQGVLARSLQYMTNRQAILLADAYFCRSRAVPGILDAVLVLGETIGDFSSIAAIKEEQRKNGKEVIDVSCQILLEAERQVCLTGGSLNLWPSWLQEANTSLKSFKVDDPWVGQKKVLVIRFSRAGKGDRNRCNLLFDENGEMVSKREIYLDADGTGASTDSLAQGHPEATLTKEEFVSCLLACPPIAEPLRRMSAADHSARQPRPLVLDVTLFSDLTGSFADEGIELESMFAHVNVSVLVEVWTGSLVPGMLDTFIGECWLPPMETLGPVPRQQVLILQRFAEGPAQSRPHGRKEKQQDLLDGMAVGALTVDASWLLDEEGSAPGGDLSGRLVLNVLRAEQLLPKKFGRHIPGMSSEHPVFVTGYAWNETTSAWDAQPRMFGAGGSPAPSPGSHRSLLGSKERQLFKTHANQMVVAPMPPSGEKRGSAEWQETYNIVLGGPSDQQASGTDTNTEVLSKQIKVCFGSSVEWERATQNGAGKASISSDQARMNQQDVPWGHQVEAYARDTIGDFMAKLTAASGQLATVWSTRPDALGKSTAQRYLDHVSRAAPQVLMVYAPSNDPTKLLKPWTFDEYKRLCAEAWADLDHWQPLDPACTFEQYAARFPFCGPPDMLPPLLRVEEASETLRVKSHHYRRFVQEHEVTSSNLEDLNTERQAFAYARYLHKDDGNSPEWRPCIARAEGSSKRSYKVAWAFTPNLSAGQEPTFDEGSVLLAPREPEIVDSSVPEHQELLSSAQDLRATGKSDIDIATALNALLEQKMQSSSGASQPLARRPPPITASIVRNHLQKLETRQLAEAMGNSSSKR